MVTFFTDQCPVSPLWSRRQNEFVIFSLCKPKPVITTHTSHHTITACFYCSQHAITFNTKIYQKYLFIVQQAFVLINGKSESFQVEV